MKIIKWITVALFVLLALLIIWVSVLHLRSFEESEAYTQEFKANAAGEFVSLEVGETHYTIDGDETAPTVILVHGFSMPMEVWGTTARNLVARGYRVVQYDLLGRGFSERPDVPYTGELFERQLIGLMDALGVDKARGIVGLSMGGAVTARVVANHPDRFETAAFIAPLHEPIAAPGVPASLGFYMFSAFYVPSLENSISPEHYGASVAAHLTESYQQQRKGEGFVRAITSSVYNFTPDDHPAYYARIAEAGIPTLLFWGTADKTVPFAQHEAVMESLNLDATGLVTFEGAGHLPHLEQPDVFVEYLTGFLR
ncbi:MULTISPECIES: alpha/beta fold hydrolase [Gammaproteobacteria]|uniref:alpha/beta fold hydrolase n=1 Tax=Gammaproteobacteria TaxID=1236 RepID=UPI000DD0B1E8|nr:MULTISPECIES: alpha/beta hydrolase [Gammaproteobacteria]RTE87352.1 alpha/beta hydrolase [Aliidiomarina sp. B3213]TCZ92862.1 alpha/beta hydrolase [Lysobacter sp. N42]